MSMLALVSGSADVNPSRGQEKLTAPTTSGWIAERNARRAVGRDATLSRGARLLYSYLLTYRGLAGLAWPAADTMALELATTRRSIMRWLAALKRAGHIVKHSRSKTVRYSFPAIDETRMGVAHNRNVTCDTAVTSNVTLRSHKILRENSNSNSPLSPPTGTKAAEQPEGAPLPEIAARCAEEFPKAVAAADWLHAQAAAHAGDEPSDVVRAPRATPAPKARERRPSKTAGKGVTLPEVTPAFCETYVAIAEELGRDAMWLATSLKLDLAWRDARGRSPAAAYVHDERALFVHLEQRLRARALREHREAEAHAARLEALRARVAATPVERLVPVASVAPAREPSSDRPATPAEQAATRERAAQAELMQAAARGAALAEHGTYNVKKILREKFADGARKQREENEEKSSTHSSVNRLRGGYSQDAADYKGPASLDSHFGDRAPGPDCRIDPGAARFVPGGILGAFARLGPRPMSEKLS